MTVSDTDCGALLRDYGVVVGGGREKGRGASGIRESLGAGHASRTARVQYVLSCTVRRLHVDRSVERVATLLPLHPYACRPNSALIGLHATRVVPLLEVTRIAGARSREMRAWKRPDSQSVSRLLELAASTHSFSPSRPLQRRRWRQTTRRNQ